MSTMKRIEQFINARKPGQLFITRDCLAFGKRGAVDQALSVMVKTKIIVRAAYGVFYRPDPAVARPTSMEIIKTKAAAFGRKVAIQARQAAIKLGLLAARHRKNIYATTGRSSSFILCESGERIHLHGTTKRKTDLAETKVGTAILALWHLGPDGFSEQNLTQSMATLTSAEQHEFRNSNAIMPGWLSELALSTTAYLPLTGCILAH